MKTIDIKKIYKKSSIIFLAVCSMMTSCDFLEIVPEEQATLEDATRNPESTLGFLYSCYNGVRNPHQNNIEGAADEYVAPEPWNGSAQKIAYGLFTPENNVDNLWQNFYRYIGQTNLFLREIENARGCNESDIEEWKAEAYFLLAYYHFELLRYYGPVPIIDHYIDQDLAIEEYPGRMHYDYVTNWIVKLLDEKVIACEYMPDKREEGEFGRATKIAAEFLKAKALVYAASPLWNGEFPYPDWKNKVETPDYGYELVSTKYSDQKWRDALTACQKAINDAIDAGYKLYDDEEYYSSNGLTDGNLPYIPGLKNPDTDGKDFRKKVMLMRYAVSTKVAQGNNELVWGLDKTDNFLWSSYPNNIIQYNNGNWFNGWSGISPTLYSAEHFYTKKGLLPKDDNSFPSMNEWLDRAGITDANRTDIIKLNVDREPRFYAWLGFDEGDYGCVFAAGSPLRLELKEASKQGYNPSSSSRNYNVTGYMMQKFIRPNQNRTKNNSWNTSDAEKYHRPLMRLADLYLLTAECCAALNDKQGVYENINPVRKRAGVPELDDELTNRSSMTLMDWVRNERFAELWCEGHRYADLKRWMIAEDYLDAGMREGLNAFETTNPSFEVFNQRIVIDQPFHWYKRMYVIPIAYNEVIKNPNLVQAPGY